jgi:Zn-dependent protease with chaperone function
MTKLDFEAWLKERAPQADDDALGEDVRRLVGQETEIDERGWAAELARKVAHRVQLADSPRERKTPIVFWSGERTAFAAPGRYVYVSRSLLEEAMPEDAVAFVFAHELAHHRLGHVRRVLPAFRAVRHLPGATAASFVVQIAMRLATSPEMERAADEFAIERCLDVGYDGRACVRLFDVLKRLAEDRGDREMAHGFGDPDELAARELERENRSAWQNTIADLKDRAARVRWERVRGYPSLADRRLNVQRIVDKRL